MTQIIKYAFDKPTLKPIYIDNAVNGLECNCICAECGLSMLAIQGKSENHREWHFRHKIDSNCNGGPETILHKIAKQIIFENSEMTIPKYGIIKYSECKLEEKYESIIPDVSAKFEDQKIFFEVAVTHLNEPGKRNFYKEKELKSIEIRLDVKYAESTPEIIKDLVLNNVENKEIVFWEKAKYEVVYQEPKSWWAKPEYVIAIIISAFGIYKFYKWLRRPNRS